MAAFTALALGIAAVGTVGSYINQAKAAKEQKRANQIQQAGEEIKDRAARRQAARQERIQRGRLVQSSSNTGTVGSSGFAGAVSSLSANYGSSVARQREQTLTSQGVSAALQKAADYNSRASFFGSFGDLAFKGLDLYKTYKTA